MNPFSGRRPNLARILILAGGVFLSASSIARADLLLQARRPEALADFYAEQLGLRPETATDAESGAPARADRFVFDLAGQRLVIVAGGEDGPRANLRLLVATTDLEAARRRLEAAGVHVIDAVDPAGEPVALFFDDPEGNPVGLTLPTAMQPWNGPWEVAGRARSVPSGRVELAIWAGLHGVGLGFALPYSLGSDSPTLIGLTMMAAGPSAAFAAHRYAGHVGLTRGQARALEFGGDFAMWQAFGWCGVNDTEAEESLLWGTVGLVGGAVGAGLLTHDRSISPGQAGLFMSAAGWGAWFGLVGTRIADANGEVSGDETLTTMLVASGAGGLAGGLAAITTDLEESRLAWMNLGGVLGTAFGFGLDLVLQVDDTAAVWAIPAATGFAGLAYTTWKTGRRPAARGLGALLPAPTDGVRWLGPSARPVEDGFRLALLDCRF